MATKPGRHSSRQARRTDAPRAAVPPRLLSLREVVELTGVSRDTIYRWGRLGKFPRHIPIGIRCSRWSEDEIMEWMTEAAAARGEAA